MSSLLEGMYSLGQYIMSYFNFGIPILDERIDSLEPT